MSPRLKQLLILASVAALAAWSGVQIADNSLGGVSLVLFIAIAAILVRVLRLPFDTVLLGLVAFGYVVGNRGFAQLMPSPYVPLLPAEAALLVCGSWALLSGGIERRLPLRPDALNWCVLAWLVAGTARVVFDVRPHGLMAVRDYAAVYYAAFFFLAQRAARAPRERRFLLGCLGLGLGLLPVLYLLSEAMPGLLQTSLQVNGVPILLYKGDLALMFQAVGSVLLFHAAVGRHRYWVWPYTVLLFLGVTAMESRATILGLAVVSLMLLAARRWHFPAVQAAAAAVALAVVLLAAGLTQQSWARDRLGAIESRLASIVSPIASVPGVTDPGSYKWDNNRFRLVWWRTVVAETTAANPLFGLGFGYDLAGNFLREYNQDMAADFTARSPHSIGLTAYGRMGLCGLAVWLLLCGLIVREAWQTLHQSQAPLEWGLWGGLIIILVAAHLGVVLEGPMGAVPFWTMLGLAHGGGRAGEQP